MARKLYIDIVAGELVSGLNSSTNASVPNLFQSDSATYELYFLQPSASSTRIYETANYASKSVKLHIAPAPPSTATAYVAQNTWSDLPTTITASVARAVTGGAGANEQQIVSFTTEADSGTFALTFPSRTIALTGAVTSGVFISNGNHGLALLEPFTTSGFSGVTGGLQNGQTLYVAQILSKTEFKAALTATTTAITAYEATTAGSVTTITATSDVIDARASADDVVAILEEVDSIKSNNVSVIAAPGTSYRIAYKNEKSQVSLPVPTVTWALTALYGKTAILNFNTTELLNAISASASIDATMEIEVIEGASTETVLQKSVTIRNDVITSGSPIPIDPDVANNFSLSDGSGGTWVISIDSDGILTAAKQ